MSTRCQIRFIFPDGKVLTYQHSDGYPTYAIPNIIDFLKWNTGRNSQYDYVVPNWFYFNKKSIEPYCDRNWKYVDGKSVKVKTTLKNCYALNFNDKRYADDHNLSTKIGYGLDYDGTLHGDIEYFYDIIFTENVTENDKAGRILSGDNEDTMTFRIEAYDVPYDWDKRDRKYTDPNDLVKYSEPFFTLNISKLDSEPKSTLDTELKQVEKVLSDKSEQEYQAWKLRTGKE